MTVKIQPYVITAALCYYLKSLEKAPRFLDCLLGWLGNREGMESKRESLPAVNFRTLWRGEMHISGVIENPHAHQVSCHLLKYPPLLTALPSTFLSLARPPRTVLPCTTSATLDLLMKRTFKHNGFTTLLTTSGQQRKGEKASLWSFLIDFY